MDFIISQFQFFTFKSYLTLIIVLGSLIYSIIYPLKDTWRNPSWSLVTANIAFMVFMSTVPNDTSLYIKIILGFSVICLCWFAWIRINEKDENESRGFVQNGKDQVTGGVNYLKNEARNIASKSVGGGLFGDFIGAVVDNQTIRADGRISSFLNFFGDSGPFYHKSRGSIGTLRFLLLCGMIFSMFYA
jgi:hypothetical protein